jgi:hypothetical protein
VLGWACDRDECPEHFLRKVLADSLPLLIAQLQHVRNLTALNAATK